jgi:galactokinase
MVFELIDYSFLTGLRLACNDKINRDSKPTLKWSHLRKHPVAPLAQRLVQRLVQQLLQRKGFILMNNQSKASRSNLPNTALVRRAEGQWVASAPGRINLIGEHTDYNLGYTLPMAIDRYTTIVAQPSQHETLTLESHALSETVSYSLDGSTCLSHPAPPVWSKYLAGVVNELAQAGFRVPPLTCLIESDVPMGAGVSSSASIEVAMAMLVQMICNRYLSPLQTALLCQRVEHRHVGVPCGLMDQLASISGVNGQLMLMDCRDHSIEQIPFPDELAVIVVNSHIRRSLTDGGYRQRREQCQAACRILGVETLRDVSWNDLTQHQPRLPEPIFSRALHVISENLRTLNVASKLAERNWQAVGELMNLSHQSMRDQFEISTPEIDLLVKIANSLDREQGVLGSRMTGGGFGGSTITLALAARAEDVLEQILQRYRLETGSSINGFVTYPADGAWMLTRRERGRLSLK